MGRHQLYCSGARAARLVEDLEQLVFELVCFPNRTPRHRQDADDRCRATITFHNRRVSSCTVIIDIRRPRRLSEPVVEGNNAGATRAAEV